MTRDPFSKCATSNPPAGLAVSASRGLFGKEMAVNNLVLQLRYLGVIPQHGYREYGFHIGDRESGKRIVILTIDDEIFLRKDLSFQEAPDLCYQKLLTGLSAETPDARIPDLAPITMSDIVQYRDAHPQGRKPGSRRRPN
jgi:hypothetical protein